MSKTYSNLFPQIIREIDKRTGQPITSTDSRYSVQPSGSGGSIDSRALAEIITTIASDLADLIEPRIISGLDITATTPISDAVTVTAGIATSNGKKWEIATDTTLIIPLDGATSVFYICVYDNAFEINKTHDDTKCEIGRIIIPYPKKTTAICDDKPDDGYDGWIISAKDIVYDEDQEFDDASVEKLRDVIGEVLADNLIGNIKLSENLKITNTQGSLELDSESLKLYDTTENLLAKFNNKGTYFYNVAGTEVARFTTTDAKIGNILITTNSLQSGNFVSGSRGFQIKDDGDVEFSDGTFRGNLLATTGQIGGFTITDTKLYGGIIQTHVDVAAGANGVKMDSDGLHVYDDVLGRVVFLPSDGSAPQFSSGTIENTTFEINTNSVLRTAETVGDGSVDSSGILINNTGLYGCEASQLLQDANLKALIDGSVRLKGTILATSGTIASITITSEKLSGGLIEGAIIRSGVFETSNTTPRVRLDTSGIYYQETTTIGKYGLSTGVGNYGFQYGDGTLYGSGVSAYLFNTNFPILAIEAERNLADIRLYNRSASPVSGSHKIGDLICVSGKLKLCTTAGSPGTFTTVNANPLDSNLDFAQYEAEQFVLENLTSDPVSPVVGQMWIRVD